MINIGDLVRVVKNDETNQIGDKLTVLDIEGNLIVYFCIGKSYFSYFKQRIFSNRYIVPIDAVEKMGVCPSWHFMRLDENRYAI